MTIDRYTCVAVFILDVNHKQWKGNHQMEMYGRVKTNLPAQSDHLQLPILPMTFVWQMTSQCEGYHPEIIQV